MFICYHGMLLTNKLAFAVADNCGLNLVAKDSNTECSTDSIYLLLIHTYGSPVTK